MRLRAGISEGGGRGGGEARGMVLLGKRVWRARDRRWGSRVGGCRVVRIRWWRYLFFDISFTYLVCVAQGQS